MVYTLRGIWRSWWHLKHTSDTWMVYIGLWSFFESSVYLGGLAPPRWERIPNSIENLGKRVASIKYWENANQEKWHVQPKNGHNVPTFNECLVPDPISLMTFKIPGTKVATSPPYRQGSCSTVVVKLIGPYMFLATPKCTKSQRLSDKWWHNCSELWLTVPDNTER